tara:strand:- start:177 stop:626 length:450 start_codon:yes stop_codon:yes gene_type:complete
MSNYSKLVGVRNVGSYQVSGTPWITGSASFTAQKTVRHRLPHISKSLTVINPGNVALLIHFNSGSLSFTGDGMNNAGNYASGDPWKAKYHYITVPASNGSVTLDVKCKEFFLSNPHGSTAGEYEVFAELTGIPTGSMFSLTGSGITSGG